jgi:hypothetical protein
MILFMAERHDHMRYWVEHLDPQPLLRVTDHFRLIERNEDLYGRDPQVVLVYPTFWRRRNAAELYDLAVARRMVIVNVNDPRPQP